MDSLTGTIAGFGTHRPFYLGVTLVRRNLGFRLLVDYNEEMDVRVSNPSVMSTAEAEEVMRLWHARQSEGVQVEDLAEALAAPSGEIESLLSQVRSTHRLTVEPMKPKLFSATGLAAVLGFVMCALIGAVIIENMTSSPWNRSSNFFYLFASVCFLYVPFSTFVLNRQRRREVAESVETKQFLLKVQRHRD